MSLRLVSAQPTVATGRPSAEFKGDKSSGSACYPIAQGPRPATHYPRFGSENRPFVLFIDNLSEAQADHEREDWATAFIRDSGGRGDFEKRICWDPPLHVDGGSTIPGLRERLLLARAVFIRIVDEGCRADRFPALASACAYLTRESAAPVAVHLDPRTRLELLGGFRKVLASPYVKNVAIYHSCERLNVALHQFLSGFTKDIPPDEWLGAWTR